MIPRECAYIMCVCVCVHIGDVCLISRRISYRVDTSRGWVWALLTVYNVISRIASGYGTLSCCATNA